MPGQEAVHAATGAHQAHPGVQDAGGQRAGEHSRGVDEAESGGAVHHLQGQPEHQLQQQVECQVPPARVDQAVAQEPPQLSLSERWCQVSEGIVNVTPCPTCEDRTPGGCPG